MKLRNKKTGKIVKLEKILFKNAQTEDLLKWEAYGPNVNSLTELNEEWEDVKEPLIKDEKIRKAVRAWAEANELSNDEKVENIANGWKLIYKRVGEASIQFNSPLIIENGFYTITELCGEKEV